MSADVELSERGAPSLASSEAPIVSCDGQGFELPPIDTGRAAWSFVVAGTLIDAMAFGFLFSWGAFQNASGSHFFYCLVGTVASAVVYIGVTFYLPFGKRYPEYFRTGACVGVGLCALSFFVASFATALWQLIVTLGVCYGLGVVAIYTPLLVWIYDWFSRRKGLAAGLIFAGGGLAGTVLPLLFGRMLEAVGFSWTLRIWSGCMAGVCSVALLFLKPRLPYPPKTAPRLPLIPRDLGFLRTPAFWTLAMAILLQAFAYLSVSIYISSYATELGYSATAGQVALSILNLSTLLGGVCIGYLTDRAPFAIVMVCATVLSALFAFLVWGFADSLALVIVFAAAFGAVGGGYSSTYTQAAVEVTRLSEYNDVSQAPTVLTTFGVFKGISAIAGPALAGSLVDRDETRQHRVWGSSGFSGMIVFVGASMLASGAFSLTTEVLRKRKMN